MSAAELIYYSPYYNFDIDQLKIDIDNISKGLEYITKIERVDEMTRLAYKGDAYCNKKTMGIAFLGIGPYEEYARRVSKDGPNLKYALIGYLLELENKNNLLDELQKLKLRQKEIEKQLNIN